MRSPTAPLSIGIRVGLAVSLLLCLFVVSTVEPAQARDRKLKLYFGHTGERGTFIYKRNGRYDRKELERINRFLRDWRKEESIRMDPQLLDLVWEIYRETGAQDYIHVISAYRSPQTNKMLRRRSRGVAKKSQHIRGKAIDFYIPDVPLAKLRATAMKKQGGGVGYYPRSGSPFVHVDTGRVRAWPRMTRKQLLALFPNGETLHLPPSGKPLPGYKRAVAQAKSRSTTTLAYLEAEPREADRTRTKRQSGGVRAWLKRVFPGGKDESDEAEKTAPAAEATEQGQLIAATDTPEPRKPRARPSAELEMAAADAQPRPARVAPADSRMIATLAFAPLPRTRPDPVFLATSLGNERAAAKPLPVGGDAIAALVSDSEEPTPVNARRATGDPVDLAFAALKDGIELPSPEDRAAIAAFAAMRAQSAAPGAEQARELTLASVQNTPVAKEADLGGPAAGVVLAPDGVPSYGADRDAMRNLIATPASYDPQFAHLAMPVPADTAAIYRAPKAAKASEMGGEPILPAAGFAKSEPRETPAKRGFFMRLFASLIE